MARGGRAVLGCVDGMSDGTGFGVSDARRFMPCSRPFQPMSCARYDQNARAAADNGAPFFLTA